MLLSPRVDMYSCYHYPQTSLAVSLSFHKLTLDADTYSGTSHNGLSKIRTTVTSIQWTNNVPPIDFAIEIIHYFSTSERRTTSYLWTMDRKRAPKGQLAVQNSIDNRDILRGWKLNNYADNVCCSALLVLLEKLN